ncbi:MAG: hypothetical protein KAQ68_04960 [Clostridiales bacterium]|nr:hypothetical protein [Clostridiales bacterium]
MNCNNIIGILIDERKAKAQDVQKVLTAHGCEIRARLGIPQQDSNSCTDKGIIIIQLCADEHQMEQIIEALNSIPSVSAQYMTL